MFYGFVFVSFKYFSFLIEMFNSDFFFYLTLLREIDCTGNKKKKAMTGEISIKFAILQFYNYYE